jgi:hypothetical protein
MENDQIGGTLRIFEDNRPVSLERTLYSACLEFKYPNTLKCMFFSGLQEQNRPLSCRKAVSEGISKKVFIILSFMNSSSTFGMKTAIHPLHSLILAEFLFFVENSKMKAAKSSPTSAWFEDFFRKKVHLSAHRLIVIIYLMRIGHLDLVLSPC